jgi:hypothetical protein
MPAISGEKRRRAACTEHEHTEGPTPTSTASAAASTAASAAAVAGAVCVAATAPAAAAPAAEAAPGAAEEPGLTGPVPRELAAAAVLGVPAAAAPSAAGLLEEGLLPASGGGPASAADTACGDGDERGQVGGTAAAYWVSVWHVLCNSRLRICALCEVCDDAVTTASGCGSFCLWLWELEAANDHVTPHLLPTAVRGAARAASASAATCPAASGPGLLGGEGGREGGSHDRAVSQYLITHGMPTLHKLCFSGISDHVASLHAALRCTKHVSGVGAVPQLTSQALPTATARLCNLQTAHD